MTPGSFSNMASSWCNKKISSVISVFVCFLLVVSSKICPVSSSETGSRHATNQTFRPQEELQKLKFDMLVGSCLSLQSPVGDLIDCVLSHQQPAFDHPQLKGQKPLEPPERPKGLEPTGMVTENFQLWDLSGEACPEGTIPIRRTTEQDMLRASSIRRFGRKLRRHVRRDTNSNGHEVFSPLCLSLSLPLLFLVTVLTSFTCLELNRFWLMSSLLTLCVNSCQRDQVLFHRVFIVLCFQIVGLQHAVGYVTGDQYYGAKASINVWAPRVSSQYEFSLSQMWVISGSFGDDLNTIEAGWQVSPELYGDNYPRFFTYWTSDAYQATGCYNLLCSGFVQTNNRVAIGAAISPTSSYSGGQFDISLLVWKDPKHGNWWLEFGNGVLVGYWPSFLFTHLRDHASMVQFGGEIVNSMPSGFHTSTQMGSGHFAGEGFGKASYFRNLQVVDWDNNLLPLSNLRVLADHPNCYDIQGGINRVWGNYFYYGGPGRNVRCP
ncbi:hypothetical protein POTOM_032206 [Populus tomentosa]|uniref:Neprosin PEP catalytic domain-containing protein n=1 Tax=Populus tomentosa TaxID=118781 RepID=A0A8X7Z3W7_POPTO|nr:hypothetical protein POTOM_032206 [Populus tomentosa]